MAKTLISTENPEDKNDRLDQVGMLISTLCAIHCVATPLLVFSVPMLAYSFHHPLFHIGIAALVVPVGVWAFWRGYRRHHRKDILALGVLGLSVVGLAAVLPHAWMHIIGHTPLTILGSAVLILAHWLNRRSCLCH